MGQARAYSSSLREEELKNKVAADWFGACDCTRIIGNIDFYTSLLANIRAAMKNLARQIEPKVYEYGFLRR